MFIIILSKSFLSFKLIYVKLALIYSNTRLQGFPLDLDFALVVLFRKGLCNLEDMGCSFLLVFKKL